MKSLPRWLPCLAATVALGCPAEPDSDEPQLPLQPPQRGEVSEIESASPAELTPQTVEEFLAWAAGAGGDERSRVREAIHRARGDQEVIAPLFERFESYYARDVTMSLVVLGILGELRGDAVAERLHEVVWRPLPESREVPHGGLNERDLVEMIQSKAVEGLAYAGTEEADRRVLEVVSDHPSAAVRSAAVDAYLFNQEDAEGAKETIRGLLKPEETFLLDRTRRSASISRQEFDERLARFYKANPELVAAEPEAPSELAAQFAPPTPAGQEAAPVRPRKDDG